MSVFSDHLNKVIKHSGVTLQYLEKESGFTAALISKIKTGNRLPDCEEKIAKLIRALHCSIEQEEQLKNEYKIDKFGREKYLCMEETRKTLESISRHEPLPLQKKITYSIEQQSVIHGIQNVTQVMEYMIDTEFHQPHGLLRMLLPLPDAFFPENVLLSEAISNQTSELKIEHIVSLKGMELSTASRENMSIARTVLNFASMYQQRYHVFYHYKIELATDLYPFCIITPRYSLLISNDCKNALFFREEDIINSLNQRFETFKQKSQPLLRLSANPIDMMKNYDDLVTSKKEVRQTTNISFCPCLLPCIPLEIALSKTNPDLLKAPYVIDFLKSYFKKAKELLIVTVFSLEGLQVFMERGIFYELPKNFHSPLSYSERKVVLRSFLNDIDSGNIVPIVLRDGRINLFPEVIVTIYHNRDILFMWNLEDIPFSSCYLTESSIKDNLSSFASYICNNRDDTYTREESLHLVKKFVERYKVNN